MKVQDIQEVRLDVDEKAAYSRGKYILASVKDYHQGEKKIVFRGEENEDYHEMLFNKLREEAEGLEVKCLGGGNFVILDGELLELSGSSSTYGHADHKKAAELLMSSQLVYEVEIL